MRKTGVTVPPLSTQNIYAIASRVRSVFASIMVARPYVPVDRVYEVLPVIIEGFTFEIVTHNDVGNDHGRTYPDKGLILIREDVYDGACRGNGRDRFTMAHELGHLFLHRNVQFARVAPSVNVPIYKNSEWQADTFASGFLVDETFLNRCSTIAEVAEMFGISMAAAECRFGR